MQSKKDQLLELARKRIQTRWDGYDCIGDFQHRAYECNYVSPYTISARNVDSELMILLQDWASSKVLNGPILHERYEVGRDPARRTNIRLQELLRRHFRCELKDTYATNVFPFVKQGSMSAGISSDVLVKAALEFAIPQITIVAPRLAVCLGKDAFNAVAVAMGQSRAENLDEAISSPFLIGKTKVCCQAHTGQMGINNRGGLENVSNDWDKMAADF